MPGGSEPLALDALASPAWPAALGPEQRRAARHRLEDVPRGLEALIAQAWERIAVAPIVVDGVGDPVRCPRGARQGVIAPLGYTRPNVRLDSRDLVIEIALRRDEPALATVRRLLGLPSDAQIAPPDDGNWREMPTAWPLHLEGSRHGGTVRFRFSAPHHDGQTSTASLCEEWCWRWLDLCAGTTIGHHDRNQVSWDLGGLGHAAIVRGDGAHRRDVHELHIPASRLAP